MAAGDSLDSLAPTSVPSRPIFRSFRGFPSQNAQEPTKIAMDLVLEVADEYVLDALYPSSMARDDLLRQSISVSTITFLGGYALYFIGASFSYYVLFDHNLMKHPRFLKNQVWKEITYACQSIPLMMVLIIPWFIAETRGYTMLYKDFNEYSLGYTLFSIVWFLFFTDMLIYWFHRWLHHRAVYAWLHKPHHKWIIPTPFASHAFHPLDGYIQGLPYHLFVVCFPLHRGVFLVLYVFVNFWTISIHDGLHVAKNAWLNGAAHHSVHHEEFVYNYGQYFTFWDRLAGSYKEPEELKAEKKTL